MNKNIVMNKQFHFDVLTMECEHNRKDWLKQAAHALAKKMLEEGCIAVHETYSAKHRGYFTTFTVITGRPERKLP